MLRTTIWSALAAILLWWFALQMPVNAETQDHQSVAPSPPSSTFSMPSGFQPMQAGARVEVARIRSGVLPGVVIGGRYDGMLRILQETYTASGRLDEQLENAVRYLIEDELGQSGYEVAESTSNSVFAEEIQDDPEPSRYLLGATITQVKLNSYSSWLSSRTQDERTIRWEVFDRQAGKVIYRHETTGTAEAPGINNLAATYEAVRTNIQALLTEPTFIAAVSQPSIAEATTIPASYEIQAVASANETLTIEQLVGRSIPAIVQIRTPMARGTGFLIDSSGLVVTNQHVVGSAFSVKVDLFDGSVRTGRVLKRDATADVALVKLEGATTGIAGLPICLANAIKVGEPVVAIGNPLALSNTVTQGVVSGFRSDLSRNLIQTDAAINPGNSGGPLFNRQGAVIGIVTEKIASRGVEGLGFALPIGESLQRLQVKINLPTGSILNPCGSPTTMALTQQNIPTILNYPVNASLPPASPAPLAPPLPLPAAPSRQ